MVSFSCEACNETMVKKKVGPHLNRCRAPVTYIDCSNTFPGQTFKDHNQCMTEDQKYQGKLYKPKQKPTPKQQSNEEPKVASEKPEEKAAEKPAKAEVKKPSYKEQKKEKKMEKKAPKPIRVTKEQSLKQTLKALSKEHKIDKKHLLEKLSVTKDGLLQL